MTKKHFMLTRERDIALPFRWHVVDLCIRHNTATSPSAYRTDHEHHRQEQRARAIRRRMLRLGIIEGAHYREWGSGNYWPLH